ncbi:MAG: hypothetical protein HY080_05340 [Gammaproteobacteria bacterium]|nr:hypothetical protein [Gammaproteobacteria bacterium]
MKLIISCVSFLFLGVSIAAAQTVPRDTLIDRIESIYAQATMLSADSPFMEMFMAPAKTANPGVNKTTWLGIKQELALSISNTITEKGGLLDKVLRKSLENLSDEELERLRQILSDPVYNKFQAAMASPATQRQFAQALLGNALKLNTAINAVLVRHNLKEVH